MNTENPQQSPLQSKQERARARKLRMSCDACSSSKTKCDQTRPVCMRCQKTGLKCNYSVSQRKGKPPAASRDLSGLANGRRPGQGDQASKPPGESSNTSGLPTPHTTAEPNFHFDRDSPMMDISLPVHDDGMSSIWPEFIPDLSDYTASDFNTTPVNAFNQDLFSLNTISISHSTQNKPTDETILNFDDEFPDVLGTGLQQPPSPIELPMPENPLPTPNLSDVSQSSRRYECTKLASSTLESLNLDSQICSASCSQNGSSTGSNGASFDQILITNKAAVENAYQLLSCPCALSQQSNLILSLIIDKILALYQTLIRTDISTRQLTPSSNASAEKPVRDTPITIGAYRMDAKDEQYMRMQLVSNELRKAAALVERYSDRYCTLGCQGREDKSIYTALTGLLKRRLKEAVGDVVNVLRNLRDGAKP